MKHFKHKAGPQCWLHVCVVSGLTSIWYWVADISSSVISSFSSPGQSSFPPPPPLQVVSQDNNGLYSGCYQTIQSVNSAVEQHQYTVRSLGLDTVWNRSKTFQYFQSICIKNITIANRRKTVRALVVFISTLLQQTSMENWSISMTPKSIRNMGSWLMTTMECPDGVLTSIMSPNNW